MIPRSLLARLTLAAAVALLVALAVYWALLTRIYDAQISERFYKELEAHLAQLTTVIEARRDGGLRVVDELTDPRFARPFGGLYWQIEAAGAESAVWASSRSLWDQRLAAPPGDGPPGRLTRHPDLLWGETRLIAVSRTVFFGAEDGAPARRARLILAADRAELDAARADFARRASRLVGLLGLALLAALAVQILVGLSPLRRLRGRLAAVAAGRAERLEGRYPIEVSRLVDEVNALLAARAESVAHARAQAGDLAHGLKTPLAILSAEARALEEAGRAEAAAEIARQVAVMRRHVERRLAQSRARGRAGALEQGAAARPVIARLVRAMRAAPGGDALEWSNEVDEAATLALDRIDLEEVAGNLLDNARKWARSAVRVRAELDADDAGRAALIIEDDGPGLPAAARAAMRARGARLDEREEAASAGLGLAIAQDILAVYGGELRLEESPEGGLRARVLAPPG